jgi:two-component system cell cycle sensor histidine kinase/response regulator CckA
VQSHWPYSVALATLSWGTVALAARLGFPAADGLALLPALGVLLAGWLAGGLRLWPGALLGALGLLACATLTTIPIDLALLVAGAFVLAGLLLPGRAQPNRADADRRAAERVRRETARLKLRHDTDLVRFAGGLAHEFNNLFTGILGHVARLEPDSQNRSPAIRLIETDLARAGELCAQIVAYTGKGTLVRQPLELNEFLRAVVADLKPKLPNDPLVTVAPADPVRLTVDAVQLRRILANLLANAAESHTRPGAPITIRFGSEPAPETGESRVWIEVADSGTGIDPDHRDRVFEPFFTTKAPGRGLGLAAVRGIARAHGGSVAFASTSGGTVVRVELLDRPTQDLIATPPPARRPTVQSESKSQRDLALVVDDDPGIRALAALALRTAGWTVLTAEHGEEALALAERHGDDLRLLVLDLLMPVLDGRAVLARLRRSGSRVPVLVMSGFSEFDLSREFANGPPMAFLHKPFRTPELLVRVAELLEKVSVEG